MDITAPNLVTAFFTSINTTLTTAYSVTDTVFPKIASVIPTGGEQHAEGWTGMADAMREWVGTRITKNPAPQTYFVPVQNWELTEAIDMFKLADDLHGVYQYRAAQLGMNIKKLEDFQLRDLIENLKSQKGTRQNGLDGLSHWSTVHPVDFYDAAKGTYCNDYTNGVTVSGVLTGGPLAVNSFLTVWQDMANRKSESGEKMNLTPDLTMVPVTLKGTAATILQTQFFGAPIIGNIGAGPGPNYALAGSTENALRGMSDILIWPDLGSVTNWYQLVTNKPRKPFSWIMRQAPNWVYRNMPTDPIVFDTHSFVYGSYARGAPAWSFAWLSSRSG